MKYRRGKENFRKLFTHYKLDGRRFLWKDMTKGLQEQCSDKTPFVVSGEMLLECQNSKLRNKLKKDKYKEEKENKQEIDNDFQKRRFLPQNSIKMGCPPRICLKDIVKFPEYKVVKN